LGGEDKVLNLFDDTFTLKKGNHFGEFLEERVNKVHSESDDEHVNLIKEHG
jgi:hypothetical protein